MARPDGADVMATQLEQLADDKVRLTVEVPAQDVHHAVEHAASDLAASVRIPGFRKGKAPMPLLVQRIGRERIYSEAISTHIGSWFLSAVTRARVNPVAQPDYEYDLPRSDKEAWRFSATVSVRPKPEPADWTRLEVPRAEVEVPEEAVRSELEALQHSVAELTPVEGRPAHAGDTVVVDLAGAEGTQRNLVIDLGSARLVEEIENALVGLSVGESREVAYETHANADRRHATVTLNEIRERVLPPLDDDLARGATEFDTLAELRADAEERLRGQVAEQVEAEFRAAALDELVRVSRVEADGPLVELRTRELVDGLIRGLDARGLDFDSYLSLIGESSEDVVRRLHAQASLSVARELVLDAVADRLGLEVTDEEIREELEAAGEEAADIDAFIAGGGADSLRDDLRLRKALDRVAAEVKPISPDLHKARESIWTPEKEQPADAPKLWTPGSKE
jgi:trigger factor